MGFYKCFRRRIYFISVWEQKCYVGKFGIIYGMKRSYNCVYKKPKDMKSLTTLSTIFILMIISSSSFAVTSDYSVSDTSKVIQRDVEKSLTAKVIGDKIYFKLTMLNESKPGMYSLVKTYADGTFESIGIKDIAVNTINQPLLYSFVEENKSDVNVSYDLIRISFNVEPVESWQYCPLQDKVCTSELFSDNK